MTIGDDIGHAADLLRAGALVAFPTETVYGLGADATNDAALRRLYAVKGRPAAHPLIVHVATADRLDDIALAPPEYARALASAFWPGPLTLVVQRRGGAVSDVATGGLSTVGVRVPDHPIALALLDRVGRGVAAPSANRFGRVSPTTARHVVDDLDGDVDYVLDGGPCRVGVESTIVDCTGAEARVLRLGGVSCEMLGAVLGSVPPLGGSTPAPGTLASHYAPRAHVELVTAEDLSDRLRAASVPVGVIAMELPADLHGGMVLGNPATIDEYANGLYAYLRAADAHAVETVLAVPPPSVELGAAVSDRLQRAAH